MDDQFPFRHYTHIIIYAYVYMLIMYMCEYIDICVYAHICMHILYTCMQAYIAYTFLLPLFGFLSCKIFRCLSKKFYLLLALGTTVD